MYSHNQIKALLSTIATNHKQIKDFGLGNLWEMGSDREMSYPLLWAELGDGSNIDGKILRVTYSLYFMDLVDKGENNEDEVLSDQLRIALDVLATLKTPSYEDLFTIDESAPLKHFTESTDDEVAGWKMDVTFLLNHLSDRCAVPGDALDDPATGCAALLNTLSEDAKNSCILPNYDFSDTNVTDNLTDAQEDDLSDLLCTPVTIQNSDETFSVQKTAADSPYTLPDIDFTDSDGTVTQVPAQTDVVCTPAAVRTYAWPAPTGQSTSYATRDDAWVQQNYFSGLVAGKAPILVNRTTLSENNSFGNTNRYTDSQGGQVYGAGNGSIANYIIDNYTGLGWWKNWINSLTWSNSIAAAAASTLGGFSDWFIPNLHQLYSRANYANGATACAFDYAPFEIAGIADIWSSTTLNDDSTYKWYCNGRAQSSHINSGSRRFIICRKHF